MQGRGRVRIRDTQLPQLLLEGVLLLAALGLLLSRRQADIRAGVGDGPLIDGLDILDPLLHLLSIRILLFELMAVAQQMHPTALMRSRIDVVGGVEVRAEDSLKAFAQQLLDHLAASGVMVLIVAHLGRTHAPDVAVLAVFAPPGLIRLHRWAGANLLLERGYCQVELTFGPVQQLDDLSAADLEVMQRGQIGLDLPHRYAHHRAQIGNQAGQLHPHPSLPDHLPTHIQRRFAPLLTLTTPAMIDHMLRHLDGGRGGSSITWRRRATLIPPNALAQTGQCLMPCSTTWVGTSRRRARLYCAARFLRFFFPCSGGFFPFAFTNPAGGVFCFSNSSMRW